MLHRSHVFATLALATLFSSSLSAGILLNCPDTISVGPVAGFANAESCGQTIATGPGSVNINVGPQGVIASDIELESWLSLGPGALDQTFVSGGGGGTLIGGIGGPVTASRTISAQGGSAMLFPSFTANAGDTLQFDWTGVFEPEATGYLFYALDGALTVLDHQFGFFGNSTLIQTASLVLPHTISQPLSAGTHSLAFGVIVGNQFGNQTVVECQFCEVAVPLVQFDPILDITNLAVVPQVPEPGSIGLMGLGLVALAVWRRKRS